MKNWFMVNIVGKDQPGIVAQVTTALYKGGCHLGEASMMRLGGNFTIMMMVACDASVDAGVENGAETIKKILSAVADPLNLHIHVDEIDGELHHHIQADARVTVFGADRPGIVSRVTSALTDGGLSITDLASDVGGTEEQPIYIMHIEGLATNGMEKLQEAIEEIDAENIDIKLMPIDSMLG